MQSPVFIAKTRVDPGTRAILHLPVAGLYTHTETSMPVHVIHGRQKGPRLFVCGAVHGDEIMGIEIIRRLLKLKKIINLKGTLIAVPVVNVYAFVHHSRYSPDRRDLNRFFPGSENGSLTSRLAHSFMEEIVRGSDFGIDLHAGSNHRDNLPQIRVNFEDLKSLEIAQAFKVPVVINSATRDGSLRKAAAKENVSTVLYEAGEALRFDEVGIRAGIHGILSVMAGIGMIRSFSKRKPKGETLLADSTSWVRAPVSGILRMEKPLGARVTKGSRIGFISDPFGSGEVDIPSPVSGMVIGRLNLPLVHQGDAIIHIAHIDRLKSIEPAIEDFREEFID
ncbi:succinylglutamate desuccinylase/aspartoacylase family protein [Desulfospira joergensenii]|uniref:succinylglutamate desuccinylase/aspartoacylase family protein n=1 Tax=Desulfospira joergensenii TaxID=53329 RepID=UPI0003B64B0C|nr:succinylglutamate desuccinylase/aspartoacylase family protein [Desulfospira joergensenii]